MDFVPGALGDDAGLSGKQLGGGRLTVCRDLQAARDENQQLIAIRVSILSPDWLITMAVV